MKQREYDVVLVLRVSQDAIYRIHGAVGSAKFRRTVLTVDSHVEHMCRGYVSIVPERKRRADGPIGIVSLVKRQQFQGERLLVRGRIRFRFFHDDFEGVCSNCFLHLRRNAPVGGKRVAGNERD